MSNGAGSSDNNIEPNGVSSKDGIPNFIILDTN